MSKPKIGIIVGSTREGQFGDKPAAWIAAIAGKRGDAEFEVIDLRDYPMPFFEEPVSPARAAPKNEPARRWGAKIAELDAFVFITAEYNHGPTAVLKNAIDYAAKEWHRKPAAFVGYGGVGGARAVEQLRLVLVEMQVAPTRTAVHIGMTEFKGMAWEGKSFADYPYLDEGAKATLDELVWWTKALKTARDAG